MTDPSPKALYQRFHQLCAEGPEAEAQSVLEQFATLHEPTYEFRALIASMRLQANQRSRALEELRGILDENPDASVTAEVCFLVGIAQEADLAWDLAEDAYGAALEANPGHWNSRNNLAALLLRPEDGVVPPARLAKAEEHLEMAHKQAGPAVSLRFTKAILLAAKGEVRAATELLQGIAGDGTAPQPVREAARQQLLALVP